MLKEFYEAGYFDYKSYVIDHALELELSPVEATCLIYLLDEYKKGNRTISINKMEEKILVHKQDIIQALSVLLERNFYKIFVEYESNKLGQEKFSVEPFFIQIEKFFDASKEELQDNDINKILTYIERKLKRPINANEYDIILQLITDEQKTLEDFKATISYIEKAKYDVNVRNIQRFIDATINVAPTQPINDELEKFMKKIGIRK